MREFVGAIITCDTYSIGAGLIVAVVDGRLTVYWLDHLDYTWITNYECGWFKKYNGWKFDFVHEME